ncbi:putative membrane protein [Candidatus Ichthyocystis hellenicum]|uniref:Putative membrane protein n=1 Tax=Candidatus Ichthyocystis hellenicum TaxID=1561003 RepID=A0A0S4M4X4_9BURK|nr:putative membrane protein [Candidatus Ichthyocystis hellenicum]
MGRNFKLISTFVFEFIFKLQVNKDYDEFLKDIALNFLLLLNNESAFILFIIIYSVIKIF